MNKKEAKAKSLSETLTFGNLRHIIDRGKFLKKKSKVNPDIPIEKIIEIYEAAIAGRPENEIVKGYSYKPSLGADRPSRDSLVAFNILRDFGELK